MAITSDTAFAGAVLGTAVGDALGLPREGLSRRRAARVFGGPPLGHRFVFGRGMVSDDTEHTCMVAQALIASRGEPDRFARSLAWRLRGWLLGLPAGVGFGTLRAVAKLLIGFPPSLSGVRSAGNGPAMRAAVVGLYAGENGALLRELVQRSTRITHTDPRAFEGALVVALGARYGAARGADGIDAWSFIEEMIAAVSGDELIGHLRSVRDFLREDRSAEAFADHIGQVRGVGGYVNHTVPVALFCWLKHRHDFRRALETAICLGGDTDTVGAIVGALAGATLGPDAIPAAWRGRLIEWPRSVRWLRRLASRLAGAATADSSAHPCRLFLPGLVPRNLLFLLVVLLHGLRRLVPPY